MNEQQQHEMVLKMTHPSGEDEWYCPTCGRRLLMDYGPVFKKTILETGDEYALHSGGKGGFQMGSMRAIPASETNSEEESVISIEDPRLAPWIAWLEEVDFESRWKDEK